MRNIFLILLLFPFIALANYVSANLIETDAITSFASLSDCEAHYDTTCIRIPDGYNSAYHVAKDEMTDDLSSPIWATRSMIEACIDETDCKARASALKCVDGRTAYYNETFTEVWCNKIIGYNQKPTGRKIVVEDAAKKAAYLAAEQVKKDRQAAIDRKKADINFGNTVVALVGVLNEQKGLNSSQLDQMTSAFSAIKENLTSGAIETARAKIAAITPDGVAITQSDIDAILSEIDNYLTLRK